MADEPTDTGGDEQELDVEVARAVIEDHGFLSWLDLSLEELADGRAVMELPHQEKLTNVISGAIHGGITATVVDTCSAFALRTRVEDPMHIMLATTDLNVKYVRPATSDLRIEAEVVRAGQSLGTTRVDVFGTAPDGEAKQVAMGATTYRLFRDDEDE